MDNAKPNERSLPPEGFLPAGRNGWSRRLEEPGALPGVGLADKEAAWDKLYDRLRETPRRRTLPWLWTAAACLLLALVPVAFLLKEKRTIPHSGGPKVAIQPRALAKPGPARTYPATGAKPSALARSSPLTAHRPSAPGSPTQNTLARITPARSSPLTARSSPLSALRTLSPGTRAHSSQLVACSLQLAPHSYVLDTLARSSPLTAHSLQLAATPKKQLRVVHINELEPAEPAPSMAGERLRPGRLRVRFTQPETFRPTTSYNNNPVDYPLIPLKHAQNP